MFVPSVILIERGLDGGPILHTKQDAFLCSKISRYQCFAVCCTETSSCVSKPLLLRCKLVIRKCLCQVSLGLKEVQMAAHDFKLYKVSLWLESQ